MKMITKLLCLLLMIIYVWAAPLALDETAIAPVDGSIIPINICPIPMCLAIELPCDDIRTSYIVVNGKRCPMCQYCASSTTTKPTTPVKCRVIKPIASTA